MPFGVTSTGFTLKTQADIRDEIDDYQRLHVAPGLILSDDTILGNQNAAVSVQLAELWELAQDIYSSFDPDVSSDWALDRLSSLTGTLRNKWTKTTVTGQVTMNPNKALPVGSIAHLTGRPNSRFVTLAEVPADPTGGTFDVVFEAEDAGTITVAAGQLSEIAVAQSGWTGVTNALVGDPGSEPETDPVFRAKRETELSASGSTNFDAIVAGVSRVSGVIDVSGSDNPYAKSVGGLPPHSVHIITRGGANQDIADAIYLDVGAGITTTGSETESVTDSLGEAHTIRFTTGTSLTFYCTMTVQKGAEWNGAASETNIKALVAAYVNSLGLGDDVIYGQVRAAVFREPGVYRINSLFIGFAPAPVLTFDLSVSDVEYAESDVANIGITAV